MVMVVRGEWPSIATRHRSRRSFLKFSPGGFKLGAALQVNAWIVPYTLAIVESRCGEDMARRREGLRQLCISTTIPFDSA